MKQHIPALDELRGIAVLVVIAYHFGWLSGGYLGVSTFMALSGFLITSILVNEFERTGNISLRNFWSKRARRLAPAALALLAGVAIYTVADGGTLSGAWPAALAWVSNWWQLLTTDGYSAIFAEPHALDHLWSLAVEEQFYLLWPLLALAALKAAGRHGVTVLSAVTVATGTALSLAVSADTAYLATFTRMAELAAGALAATVVVGFRKSGAFSEGFRYVGAAALVAATFTFSLADASGLFLPVHGVLAALVIQAWSATDRKMLPGSAGDALALVGRVSYGLYLWHWPATVWFDSTLVAIAAMTALTAASYWLIERPARLGGRRALAAGVVLPLFALTACAEVAASVPEPQAAVFVEVSTPVTTVAAAPAVTQAPAPSETAAPTTTEAPRPITVLIVGDSTAADWGEYMETLSTGMVTVVGEGYGGCAILGSETAPWVGVEMAVGQGVGGSTCLDWRQTWGAAIAEHQPDIVLYRGDGVSVANLHLSDVEGDQSGGRIVNVVDHPELFSAELAALGQMAHDGGAEFWIVEPQVLSIDVGRDFEWSNNSPERTAAWGGLLAAGADHVVPASAWFEAQTFDPRPDGAHLSPEALVAFSGWVFDQLADAGSR